MHNLNVLVHEFISINPHLEEPSFSFKINYNVTVCAEMFSDYIKHFSDGDNIDKNKILEII